MLGVVAAAIFQTTWFPTMCDTPYYFSFMWRFWGCEEKRGGADVAAWVSPDAGL